MKGCGGACVGSTSAAVESRKSTGFSEAAAAAREDGAAMPSGPAVMGATVLCAWVLCTKYRPPPSPVFLISSPKRD